MTYLDKWGVFCYNRCIVNEVIVNPKKDSNVFRNHEIVTTNN